MLTRSIVIRRLSLALLFAVPAISLAAQDEPPVENFKPWRMALEKQLRDEKSCELFEVLLFDELTKNNETILEGKIACLDGRQFDFVRHHDQPWFELTLCEPTVC